MLKFINTGKKAVFFAICAIILLYVAAKVDEKIIFPLIGERISGVISAISQLVAIFVVFFYILSGVVLVIAFLVSVIYGLWRWRKTRQIKHLLRIPGFTLLALLSPAILTAAFLIICEIPGLIDYSILACLKPRVIELGRLSKFEDNKYYSYALITHPRGNTDSMKTMMARFFNEKSRLIDSTAPGRRIRAMYFYEYTRETAYFIHNEEVHDRFFGGRELNQEDNAKIGYIYARQPCDDDSTKYEDAMYLYEKGDRYKETAAGLYSECAVALPPRRCCF